MSIRIQFENLLPSQVFNYQKGNKRIKRKRKEKKRRLTFDWLRKART